MMYTNRVWNVFRFSSGIFPLQSELSLFCDHADLFIRDNVIKTTTAMRFWQSSCTKGEGLHVTPQIAFTRESIKVQ